MECAGEAYILVRHTKRSLLAYSSKTIIERERSEDRNHHDVADQEQSQSLSV